MIFHPTELPGAYLIELEQRADERGFFARTWCADELAAHGLTPVIAQANIAYNHHRGTLRGMHFQHPPHAEVKIVRCTRGAIYDVIIDLRPDSPAFKRWIGVELSADNYRMLYVPEGFAHGYQTLSDASEVTYNVSAPYAPGAEGGVRYDDPAFAIDWPLEVTLISPKDAKWPDFV